jgi:probable F420-dependent oxidoreductase
MEKVVPLRSSAVASGRPIPRLFRFGVVAATARSATDWLARARRAEALGYDTLVIPDNLQYTLAPIPALAAAAAATTTLRIGTYVLANDLRNPVLLAKDIGSLDLLSGGRFELGLGAGRPDAEAENRMLGLPFDSGAVRVARLAESIAVLKALQAGQRPATVARFYSVAEANVSPQPTQQPRVPLLVAGSGRQLLQLAAREADIIAIGLPPDATADVASERLDWIREAAGERFAEIELNINLMAVGDRVPRWIEGRLGLTARDLADRGSLAALVGTTDQMCEQLLERRRLYDLSYILVADEFMDLFAPVVERLAHS